MTSIKTLEQSIFWQRHVLAQSRNPAQKARCFAAILRLQAQIDAAIARAKGQA